MNQDRTAVRPRHLCTAYSCPLLGVMSESTRGGDDWYCFCHFGKEAGAREEITTHLRGMDWLCQAVTNLRTLRGEEYVKFRSRVLHDLRGNHVLLAEFDKRGFAALEDAISAQLKELMQQRPIQTQLAEA
jgi:hypothetical protein